jgi:hypothetical protein
VVAAWRPAPLQRNIACQGSAMADPTLALLLHVIPLRRVAGVADSP